MKSIMKSVIVFVLIAWGSCGFAQIIPNASYYVIEGYEKRFLPFDRPEKKPTYALFYSYNGDVVGKFSLEHMDLDGAYCNYKIDHDALKKMIDPQAPKPQPIKYVVEYWPGIQVKGVLWFFTATKGCPGHFIAFIDKNGNCIWHDRYNPHTLQVTLVENNSIQSYNVAAIKCLDLTKITFIHARHCQYKK